MKNFHRLPLRNAKNVRDLGGFPCKNGSSKFHIFCRGASLAQVDEDDAKFLREYGIKTILDLRSKEELELLPDSPALNSFNLINIDFTLYPTFPERLDEIIANNTPIADTYLEQLEQTGVVKKIFDAIDECILNEQLGILFHCLEGKDRTGLLAMLLMSIISCSDEDIYGQYELSATLLGYRDLDFAEDMARFSLTSAYTMKDTLDLIRSKYGSVVQMLLDFGIKEEQLRRIRQVLVDGE